MDTIRNPHEFLLDSCFTWAVWVQQGSVSKVFLYTERRNSAAEHSANNKIF